MYPVTIWIPSTKVILQSKMSPLSTDIYIEQSFDNISGLREKRNKNSVFKLYECFEFVGIAKSVVT